MKKYLYEIDCCGYHVQGIPFMPRVFAEKQAKQMNKDTQRQYGKLVVKYTTSKTSIPTNDATPRGWASWEEWYIKTFGQSY